uniref:Uncharacterized LOC100705945 n=1 Tax=Oreochromis niloticus TaxID=8128 RepID=A0A669D1M3_ORENI
MSRNTEKALKEVDTQNRSCQIKTETLPRLLDRLHLQDKLQQKLSPEDFLQIGPPVKQHHVESEKDLACSFLQRLIILDYRARYTSVRSSCKIKESFNASCSDWDVFVSSSLDTQKKEKASVHPMDVQMAVFHCSDSFLKQMMITKLSQCQYALPLLVPDPVTKEIQFPLWTFREVTKTWKVIQCDSEIVTMKSVPVYKAKTPLVSFFRLGSLSVSKSQIMNNLINDRHDTFFHRNSSGSTEFRYLMDGVAEITWYCPAGKPNDAFSDCIAFCNLHGDALLIEKQRDILIEKSSVNVFFVASLQNNEESESFISSLLKSHKPFICLTVDNSRNVIVIKKGKYKMGLKDRSHSDVSEHLKRIIREILTSVDGPILKPSFQLETMAELSGIRVDETDPACQRGKSAAMEIINLLKKDNMDVSKIKDEFLPCQGKLWHQWSKIHRELFHLRGNIEKEKSKKQQELMNIRQKQCAASCSKLMELFTGSLSSLPPTDREYFLKWTQIFIDVLSTHDLSSILQSYDEKWSEVLALTNKWDKSDLLLKKQTELDDISKKLQSVTFGLEHIFREMGQIYEAHKTTQRESRHTDWSKYPELAAQLMISGHPMELMDGDAGHVPLTWISSLLEEVIKKLGNQRVFVLSVLGLQSSGKSTMLNTMFGLQFAVSAGRCTKGAFMQLLKVSEEMKKDLKFDYVLVVDTEGLRALKVESNNTLHHDNELATLVVGLGNLTLINIFGENPSDMQDILQIVVQAFVRMKIVKLSPSCVFVHQNVTDVAAAEKNMDGKRRLQEKLDQMAKLAAEEEVCDAECFSDVIEFNVQTDVKYCAQLWEGSPPMAPPNPGYSESIQEVKNAILSKASKSAGITLSQFKTNIQDLWTALLNMPRKTVTEILLDILHLQDNVQQKLSPADFLQIRPAWKQMNRVTSEKDLAHTFLHRLIMLDYRARYIPVRSDSPEVTNLKPTMFDNTETDDNDLEELFKTTAGTNKNEKAHVHPMDVQMAVFHCSDSFLKQMMITKLSQCQYALPLLVLDPVTKEIQFPLWTLREITKTWKVTQIKDNSKIVTMKSVPVYKAETPLVSFFRLGSLSVSKSQLMNTLINDRHDTFFHRNCPGSTKSRYLMDGVAEITWYCPAGKPNDAFNDCIAFCNLHGDALLIEKQCDILIEKSSINIFLVASLQSNEESRSFISSLVKSHKPLICLTVDGSCDAVKTKKGNYIMGLKDKSQSDVSEHLKRIIREVLSSLNGPILKPSFQLETMAELSGIRVDETDPACQRGKSAAVKIISLLKKDNMDVSKIKDEFLPCQGKLWHQWSKIHREMFHLRGNIEMEKSKKQQELMNIRQKQCAASCSKLMELFTGSLSSLPQQSDARPS